MMTPTCTPLILLTLLLLFANVNTERIVLSQIEGDNQSAFELTLSRSHFDDVCTFISSKTVQRHRLLSKNNGIIVQRKHVHDQSMPTNSSQPLEWLQIFSYTQEAAWSKAAELCPSYVHWQTGKTTQDLLIKQQQQQQPLESTPVSPPIELFPLVTSGPSWNRVDVTFFADGYISDEKEKFLADAKRLAEDISYNHTFASVKPLLNFWAAFSPSQESGIGVGGIPKNTVYGLYRDGTELRAVYCSKLQVARLACQSLGTMCDYPLLLGNDPYYGGLGGEFTISTASEINGPSVLRHELGHSIIETGEEYDGGFAYYGVNAVHNVTKLQDVTWAHWLSNPENSRSNGQIKIERSNMPFQVYAWEMLNTTTPWSATFPSSGNYARYRVRFSLSGLPHASALKVYLDDNDLGWKPREDIGLDRWHYDILGDTGLTNTVHELRFELHNSSLEGFAQLCSAEIIEYGDENEFHSADGNYGVYPTFSIDNATSYRPTNEQCLMRLVTSSDFCNVCLEGLWLSLLSRINLIDYLNLERDYQLFAMEIIPIPLGQFRSETRSLDEVYSIEWTKDDVPLSQYSNLTRVAVHEDIYGTWQVIIRLHTPQVRMDPDQLLQSRIVVKILPKQPPSIEIL